MKGEIAGRIVLRQALPRAARRANFSPIELALGSGVHGVVGAPSDGTLLIADLVGGFEPGASGDVRVAGRDPSRDPPLRARIGTLHETPRLPSAPTVGRLLQEIDDLRGGRTARETLGALGLAHWADRPAAQLTAGDLRAVELVVAVSTPDPLAIVLTEPGADMAPVDRQELRTRLWRAADEGACVVVATASMSDALEFAGAIHVFERGRITRWVPVDEIAALVPGRGVTLRIEVDLPRLLVASLADEPSVVGVDWDERGHRSVLTIRGDDLDRLALAVARAATASGASIRSIAPVAPQLDEVRAAASGLALAAYHAAYRVYLERQPTPPGPAEGG